MRLFGILLAATFLATISARPARQRNASRLDRRIFIGNGDDDVGGGENQVIPKLGSQSLQGPSQPPNTPLEMNTPPTSNAPSAPTLSRGLPLEKVLESFPVVQGKPWFSAAFWDDHLRKHPEDVPDDGDNYEECLQNWEALLHGSGDIDKRRKGYYEAKCRRAHGLEEEFQKITQGWKAKSSASKQFSKIKFRDRFGLAGKGKAKASENQNDQPPEQEVDPNMSNAINTAADVAGNVGLGIGGLMIGAKSLGQLIGEVGDGGTSLVPEIQ